MSKIHFVNLDYRRVQHVLQITLDGGGFHDARVYKRCGHTAAYEPQFGSCFTAVQGKVLFDDPNKVWPWKNRDLMAKITNEIVKVLAPGDPSFKEETVQPKKGG